jgi:hypothetical protein
VKTLLAVVVASAFLLPAGIGCGNGSIEPTSVEGSARSQSRAHGQRQAAKRRAVHRHRATLRAHRAAIRRAHRARAAARERQAEEARAHQQALIEKQEQAEESEASECNPNYSGACLDPYSSDYDCEGGSGNGPDYTGEVAVVGEDQYGLDADSDGIGCEPY